MAHFGALTATSRKSCLENLQNIWIMWNVLLPIGGARRLSALGKTLEVILPGSFQMDRGRLAWSRLKSWDRNLVAFLGDQCQKPYKLPECSSLLPVELPVK